TPQAFEIILESVVSHIFNNVALGQFREMGELHQKSCKILKTAAQDLFPLKISQIREGHAKVAHSRAALASREVKSEPRERSSDSMGNAARHKAENAKY